jgi:hypothetical protein
VSIHPASTIVREDDLLSAAVDDGLVLFSVRRSQYFAFDEITSAIWTCLDAPITFAQLVERLLAQFDVSAEECAGDVKVLLEDFATRGLISVLPPGSPITHPVSSPLP